MIDDVYKIDTQHAGRELTEREQDAARNAIKDSQHVCLQFLPNHCINTDGDLQGFVFSCPDDESCQRLPINRMCTFMTTVYECRTHGEHNTFNTDAMHLAQNLQHYQSLLSDLAEELRCSENPRAGFHCISNQQGMLFDNNTDEFVDQVFWEPSMPSRMGIYHAFTRCHGQDTRQHKIFIVISGCEWQAAEEFHALWQDFAEQYTAKQLCDCEELLWLRSCTLRSQQRVAARIAELCNLSVPLSTDIHCPCQSLIAHPIIQTYQHDIMHNSDLNRVMLCNNASFVSKGSNGILFNMFSSEGLWLFCGPADNAAYNPYGALMRHVSGVVAFPSNTVQFHAQYPPDKKHYCVQQTLQNIDEFANTEDLEYHADTAMLCKQMLNSLLDINSENENDSNNSDNPDNLESDTPPNTNEMAADTDTKSLCAGTKAQKNTDTQPMAIHGGFNGIVYSDISKHRGTYLYPDERFLQRMQGLGFDRNDGIVILMPLCVFMHNENSV